MTQTTTLRRSTKVRVGRDTYELSHDAAAELAMSKAKKQKTYLLKAACPECGYTIRITKTHIAKAGTPPCPHCSDFETGYLVPIELQA